MENHVPKNHYRYTSIPKTRAKCAHFKKDTGFVDFLAYSRQYDSGRGFSLMSCEEWAEAHCDKYLFNPKQTTDRLKNGWNYWKRNRSECISAIMEDARDNFDIAARIEFVSRDEVNKCYHLFSFYSDKAHEDKAYRFYDVNRGKLLKFISYFLREAASLIKKANQRNNLIQIPGYDIKDIENPMRNYDEELKFENPRSQMADRAFEIMMMYANGFSKKQIAEMLNKSHETIQTFIHDRLYKQCGFKDRIDMRKYAIDKGYDNISSFFLGSYTIYINGAGPEDTVH